MVATALLRCLMSELGAHVVYLSCKLQGTPCHGSTMRPFPEKIHIIWPMINRICIEKACKTFKAGYFSLIRPVEPKYGIPSREELSQHSCLTTVF